MCTCRGAPHPQTCVRTSWRKDSVAAPGVTVLTVHGVPARRSRGSPDTCQGSATPSCIRAQDNPGSVSLWLNRAEIEVMGHFATSDLVGAASSLR